MSNVIVDFDGTIADSLPKVIELYYMWSKREPFTSKQIDTMRNMTLKQVLKEVNLPLWRVPGLLVRARKEFGKYIGDIEVFTGMPEVLQTLKSDGHKLFVMSSNSTQNINKFLSQHKIDSYFESVHGNMGIFGKASAMKAIINKSKSTESNWYAIGDETRDIEAAKKAGIKCIAVTWGYNGSQILESYKPDFIVSKPAEIVELIQ
jgi:phosphoglycolate phosphatase